MNGVSAIREEYAMRMHYTLIPVQHDVTTRHTWLLVLRAVDDVNARDNAPRRDYVREHAQRHCSCLALAVKRRVDEQCRELFIHADGASTTRYTPQRGYW